MDWLVVFFLWCLTPLSTILWRSVLLVEENVIPGENHRPATSHRQTLSHNVVHLTRAGFELPMSVVIGIEYIMDKVKYGRNMNEVN